MQKNACFYIGYFSKVIGHRGDIQLNLDVDDPHRYQDLESVFIQMNVQEDLLVPFFLDQISILTKGKARVHLEGINDQVSAKSIVGKQVFLPLELLPELSGNQFYFHEINDYEVVDSAKGNIGKIRKVLEYPHQAIFEILHPSGKEILIPITDDVVQSLDRKKKMIHIQAPDGLIELYLDPT